jgi:Lon-like ATP-dependent protease
VVKGVEKAAAEADEATQEGLKKKGIDPASISSSSSPSAPCVVVTEENLHKFVGSPIFTSERIYDQLLPGVTTGLAWTAMGGSTLYTECVIADANASQGSLKASGHLKDVYVFFLIHPICRAWKF